MNQGQTVFSQIMHYLPTRRFATCAKRYNGNAYAKHLTCLDQFKIMALWEDRLKFNSRQRWKLNDISKTLLYALCEAP